MTSGPNSPADVLKMLYTEVKHQQAPAAPLVQSLKMTSGITQYRIHIIGPDRSNHPDERTPHVSPLQARSTRDRPCTSPRDARHGRIQWCGRQFMPSESHDDTIGPKICREDAAASSRLSDPTGHTDR
ncbi:hypothetical protein Tdes44962_MAKER02112 [Teratosphaeria destructans]|uniref:Uncharacterized protein n=1 Tax=Teratosphaeria destructans TaxID=418781 RepID=A0A9W7W494_9PEZI|nr:hypothetical protein Tdes44962_MAKER02112 [Teratosphaeria destructans]